MGEVFDHVVPASMIDRVVHHAEVIALKGDSYRLKDRDLGRVPRPRPTTDKAEGDQFSSAVDRTLCMRRCVVVGPLRVGTWVHPLASAP